MPTKKSTTSTSSNISESQKLTDAMNALREQLKKNQPKTGWRRIVQKIGNGVLSGIGLAVGSTLIAGLVFVLLQQIVTSSAFQDRVSEAIGTIVSQSISEAVGN